MKSYTEYFTDAQKVYEFKLRLAVEADNATMDLIEAALDAYKLESISKPKRLPVQEDIINFPSLGPVEINLIDISLGYPVISEDLHNLINEQCGIDKTHICVYTKAQEFDRTMPELSDGEAILGTEDPDQKQESVYGDEYNEKMLKDVETRQMPFAAPNKDKIESTNDLPQGNDSPMSQQNKLPKADD